MTIALITLAIVFLAREVLHSIENDRIRAADAAERAGWAQERQTLLQRIQAPREAVVAHMQADIPEQSPWPLTEEESVRAQDERAAALYAIEQMEREEAAETARFAQ